MEPFATNLRRRAEELRISNAEAARRIGLSELRYGNYVSGRREPDLATLVRIAAVLRSSPDRLLSFDEAEETSPEENVREQITAAASVLPREDLERVAVMIGALANSRQRNSAV